MPKGVYTRGTIKRKPLSEETKEKISESLKGHKVSTETKEKIRSKLVGRIRIAPEIRKLRLQKWNIAYRLQHKEELAKRAKEYKKANKEKIQNSRKEYRRKNHEQILKKVREWQRANPEKSRACSKNWRQKNTAHVRNYHKNYSKTHRAERTATQNKRRALYLRAMPSWADLVAIKEFYKNCPKGYHVDHIVPLNHPLVCGLHVLANLQYLPAQENLKKHNKLVEVSQCV